MLRSTNRASTASSASSNPELVTTNCVSRRCPGPSPTTTSAAPIRRSATTAAATSRGSVLMAVLLVELHQVGLEHDARSADVGADRAEARRRPCPRDRCRSSSRRSTATRAVPGGANAASSHGRSCRCRRIRSADDGGGAHHADRGGRSRRGTFAGPSSPSARHPNERAPDRSRSRPTRARRRHPGIPCVRTRRTSRARTLRVLVPVEAERGRGERHRQPAFALRAPQPSQRSEPASLKGGVGALQRHHRGGRRLRVRLRSSPSTTRLP